MLGHTCDQAIESIRRDSIRSALIPNINSRITSYNVCYTKLLRSLYLVIGAAGCVVAAVMASRTVKGRMMLDRWQLAVPVAGETYRHYITARLTRTMGAVLSGGTPLVEAVKISGGVMENVITSYSIHYTKLYECGQRPGRRLLSR